MWSFLPGELVTLHTNDKFVEVEAWTRGEDEISNIIRRSIAIVTEQINERTVEIMTSSGVWCVDPINVAKVK